MGIPLGAVLWGPHPWADIAGPGETPDAGLKTGRRLPNGGPSHDPFRYVFARRDPVAFQRSVGRWLRARRVAPGRQRIAIAGKAVRGPVGRRHRPPARHVARAWATETHRALGPVGPGAKSNEITAIPRGLAILDVAGAIVPRDAMGCQTGIAQQIQAQGAD